MSEHSQQALANATNSASTANYGAIFAGLMAKGIPEPEIVPRVNVFTYDAWIAIGRQVRRGEHGVRVCTWVPMTKKDDAGVPQPIGRKPKTTTVFHISQTDPIAGATASAEVKAPAPAEVRQSAPATRQRTTPAEYYSEQFTPL